MHEKKYVPKPRKRSMLTRVDREVWGKLQNLLPEEDSQSISRIVYNTSMLRLEGFLRRKDKGLTNFLRGKHVKKK